MKHAFRVVVFALLAVACSPVYDFSYPRESGLPPAQSLAARLAKLVSPLGYEEVKLAPGVPAPMSGDSGAYSCPSASDYHVFEKNFGSPGYSGVTVHVYECDRLIRIAVVSSTGAEHEAREVRALIQAEFSKEIESGVVESRKRYRIVLE